MGNFRRSGQLSATAIIVENPVDWILMRKLLRSIQAHFFKPLDLSDSRIVNGDLHRPEFQRAYLLTNQLKPRWQIGICVVLISLCIACLLIVHSELRVEIIINLQYVNRHYDNNSILFLRV